MHDARSLLDLECLNIVGARQDRTSDGAKDGGSNDGRNVRSVVRRAGSFFFDVCSISVGRGVQQPKTFSTAATDSCESMSCRLAAPLFSALSCWMYKI